MLLCMRTTIRINDQLFREAKKLAAETSRSLTMVVEDALRLLLAQRKTLRASKSLKLTTFKGKGLQPGVDLDDSASLLDLMEEKGDPD